MIYFHLTADTRKNIYTAIQFQVNIKILTTKILEKIEGYKLYM